MSATTTRNGTTTHDGRLFRHTGQHTDEQSTAHTVQGSRHTTRTHPARSHPAGHHTHSTDREAPGPVPAEASQDAAQENTMNTLTPPAARSGNRRLVLHCAAPSCHATITPDPRHVANLTARGAWLCDVHSN